MLSVDDIREILAIPLLGIIPESGLILNASNNGIPITLTKELSDVSIAYMNASLKILGKEEIEYNNQNTWTKKLLKSFGFTS
jgi:septum site-determining protein MinD